ncbi:Armadillo repeat-containing protein [Quillaja saponaria]|uniref:Armadillo repeat-containing protein n=1 Tax=Quillaja saponaria TaxID=32244 RepID=A0AAD7P6F4_QUISA|nr:Armadillo repeat-containing protein [Quillaja saponaria]
MASDEKRIENDLSYPILLSERVRATVDEAESFKFECAEVGKQVDRLCQMLRTMVRFATATPNLYEPPIRRVVAEVCKNLERTLILVRKCKRRSILRRVVTIVTVADFRKVLSFLEASIGDMKWLIDVFDAEGAEGGKVVIQHSLPQIASNDPMLSWIWSHIATVQMGLPGDRCEAAKGLASLANDNDRNKTIIVEEGGVPPLLKLFKEGTSPEAQIAAATALYNLANDRDRVQVIVIGLAIPNIVQVLGESPMGVQIEASRLVARMAEHDPVAQEDFARENVIRPLVTLLSFETFLDGSKDQLGKQSIHSILQINKELEKNSLYKSNSRPVGNSPMHMEGSSRTGHSRKERENEDPEIKLKLKISCARALWMLAKGSVSNSRKLTETKGLLCLAKLVENDQGERQFNCLMTIMEIAAAAESNADLRRAAFKTNSPAAKAVVEQLLRVIQELDNPSLQIPAIKSIGSLARTFSAKETRVIGPLVTQISHRNLDVAAEAAIALGKFACPENFLCVEHSKAIIEFKAIPQLMRLLRNNEHNQLHGLILLCYLALHAGNSESLEQARVLTALEGADRTVFSHHPELRELVSRAIYHLNLYHTGVQSQIMS